MARGPCSVSLDVQGAGTVRPELDLLVEDEGLRAAVRRLGRAGHGLFLVSGPTGSGKTSLLYALLAERDGEREKILSVEDPVELPLDGVGQVAVNFARGLTFAAALKSFLRSDPDVLMAGEIRDAETACILKEAALTGHMVFSCLHARDAASALLRLLDVGLAPYEVGDAVTGILASRLLRRLCPHCKLRDEEADGKVHRAVGCPRCRGGYLGRVAVHELLEVGPEIRRLLCAGPSWNELHDEAMRGGLRPLRDAAQELVRRGETSLAEFRRVFSPGLDEGRTA